MKISYETKKAEAVKRMKQFDIYDETIAQFEHDNALTVSDPFWGEYFVDGNELDRIRKFENEFNILIYYIIHSYYTIGSLTGVGLMENYLFVSDNNENWSREKEEIDEKKIKAFVYNKKLPLLSSIDYIEVKVAADGSLKRTK